MEKVEKFRGTEIILSNENTSLKQKIKDLQEEIERLKESNIRMGSRLQTIRKVCCYDDNDAKMSD